MKPRIIQISVWDLAASYWRLLTFCSIDFICM